MSLSFIGTPDAYVPLLEPVVLTLRCDWTVDRRVVELWSDLPSLSAPDIADAAANSTSSGVMPSVQWHAEPAVTCGSSGTEYRVVTIPVSSGRFEYTARCVSLEDPSWQLWAGKWGANNTLCVLPGANTTQHTPGMTGGVRMGVGVVAGTFGGGMGLGEGGVRSSGLSDNGVRLGAHNSADDINSSTGSTTWSRGSSPDASGGGTSKTSFRSKMALFFPRMYRMVLRRLARGSSAQNSASANPCSGFTSDSDALAAYVLSLLLSEMRVRGESSAVAAAVADMCLRLTAWATTRSHLSKLARRWLGDAAAQRAATLLWALPPPGVLQALYGVGVEEEASPGGRALPYTDVSRWSGSRGADVGSLASSRRWPQSGSNANLAGEHAAGAVLGSSRIISARKTESDAYLASRCGPGPFAAKYVVFSDVPGAPTQVTQGSLQESRSFADGLSGEVLLGASPSGWSVSSDSERSITARHTRASNSQSALSTPKKLAGPRGVVVDVVDDTAGGQFSALCDSGKVSQSTIRRLAACQRGLAVLLDMAMTGMDDRTGTSATPTAVDQIMLELLLGLLRAGAWRIAPAALIDSTLFFVQVPLDTAQRAWMHQILFGLYMPNPVTNMLPVQLTDAMNEVTSVVSFSKCPRSSNPASPGSSRVQLTLNRHPGVAVAAKEAGVTTQQVVDCIERVTRRFTESTSSPVSPRAVHDCGRSIILESAIRRNVVAAVATALLRRVRLTSLHVANVLNREEEMPVILVSSGGEQSADPDYKRPDSSGKTNVSQNSDVKQQGENMSKIGQGSGPITPERHTGYLPSAKRPPQISPEVGEEHEMRAAMAVAGVVPSLSVSGKLPGSVSPRPLDALDSAARARAAVREAVHTSSLSRLSSTSPRVREDVLGDGLTMPRIGSGAALAALAQSVSALIQPQAIEVEERGRAFSDFGDIDFFESGEDALNTELMRLAASRDEDITGVMPQLGNIKDLCAFIVSVVKEFDTSMYGYEDRVQLAVRTSQWQDAVVEEVDAARTTVVPAGSPVAWIGSVGSVVSSAKGAASSALAPELLPTLSPVVVSTPPVAGDTPAPSSPGVLEVGVLHAISDESPVLTLTRNRSATFPTRRMNNDAHPFLGCYTNSVPGEDGSVITPKAIRATTPHDVPMRPGPGAVVDDATSLKRIGDSEVQRAFSPRYSPMNVGYSNDSSSMIHHHEEAASFCVEPVSPTGVTLCDAQSLGALKRTVSSTSAASVAIKAILPTQAEQMSLQPIEPKSTRMREAVAAAVRTLPVPPTVAPPRIGPAHLVSAFTHALVRLSPATCGEFDVLVHAAGILCAEDEAVARYITMKLLNSWPRHDSEKEKACLSLICSSLNSWASGIERSGGSCLNVDGDEAGIVLEDRDVLLKRVVARVTLCIRSRHTAVSNEAVMQCLPRSMASSKGQAKASAFGAFLLADATSLLAVARALESNGGVVRPTMPSPPLDNLPKSSSVLSSRQSPGVPKRNQDAAGKASLQHVPSFTTHTRPLHRRSCSASRAADRGLPLFTPSMNTPSKLFSSKLEENVDAPLERSESPGTKNLEFGRRAVTRIKQRPGDAHAEVEYGNPTVGLVGTYNVVAVESPEMLSIRDPRRPEQKADTGRRDRCDSLDSVDSSDSETTVDSRRSPLDNVDSCDDDSCFEVGGVGDTFGFPSDPSVRDLVRDVPRTRAVTMSSVKRIGDEEPISPPSLTVSRGQSGRSSARLRGVTDTIVRGGSVATAESDGATAKKRWLQKFILASLSLTDSVIMAVTAHHNEQKMAAAVSNSSSESGPSDTNDSSKAKSPSRMVRSRREGRDSPGFNNDIPLEQTVVSSPTIAAPPPREGTVSARAKCTPSISSAVSASPLNYGLGKSALSQSAPASPAPFIPSPSHHACYGLTGVMIKLPPPPSRKAVIYGGAGHWSNTVRYNSMVVLQQLDKALKEKLVSLQEEASREGFNVTDMVSRMFRRRKRQHDHVERYIARGMDPLDAILRAQRKHRRRRLRRLDRLHSQSESQPGVATLAVSATVTPASPSPIQMVVRSSKMSRGNTPPMGGMPLMRNISIGATS